MIRTSSVVAIIFVVVIVLAGGWWYISSNSSSYPSTSTNSETAGKISPDTDTQIRSMVEAFGQSLKNVSLLAATSTVAADIGAQYGPYLSSDLLAQWQSNPSLALGRKTSSPAPNRIDISTVTASGDNKYTVEGSVVETTSADTASTTPHSYPIILTISQQNGVWVITEVKNLSN